MAKKATKTNSESQSEPNLAGSIQGGFLVQEGNIPTDQVNVPEIKSKYPKKGVWNGPPGSIYKGGKKSQARPSQVLLDYRQVYRGTISAADMAKSSIQSILQLKMEDNARFLAEYAKLEREHDDRKARHRLEVHKGIAESAKAEVAKDATTEDTLLLLDELLAEAVAASKR